MSAGDEVIFKRSGPSANALGWVTFNVRAEYADEAQRRLLTQLPGPQQPGRGYEGEETNAEWSAGWNACLDAIERRRST